MGLFDASMLVIGGIIGAGIFLSPSIVADHADALLAPAKKRLAENRELVRRFIDVHERLRWTPPPAGSVVS